MEVNFACDLPCATCASTSRTSCTSCYSIFPQKYLHSSKCHESCPSGMYEDPIDNVCRTCSSNCLECDSTAVFCTKCPTFYVLSAENTCEGSSGYPWPFLACSVLFSLAVAACIIFRRETTFRESSIALISWAEIAAWIAGCIVFGGLS